MPKRPDIFTALFQNWGFGGAGDYLATVFGLKAGYYTAALQLLIAFLSGMYMFVAEYVWTPAGAAGVIVSIEFANAYYGYRVSKEIEGVGFRWSKFAKTRNMIISDLVLLAMLHNAIKYYPDGKFMDQVLFWWLFYDRARAMVKHMALLKLQNGELVNYVRGWLLSRLKSDIGARIVDNIQEKKKEEDKPKEGDIL